MKKRYYLPLLYATTSLLSACGSDDTSPVSAPVAKPTPQEIVTTPIYDNFEVNVRPSSKFDEYIDIYLGDFNYCQADGNFCAPDNKSNMATPDDSRYVFQIKASKIKELYPQSISSHIMADGQYTMLDALLAVGEVRADFEVELGEFDPAIGTYHFKVSLDANNDGKFTLEGDGKKNYKNPDWYAKYLYDPGEFRRDDGEADFETTYSRLDLFPIKNRMALRIEHFPKAFTDRREYLLKKEVNRLEHFGGEMIIPEFSVGKGVVAAPEVIATNIKLRPHNIRSDIFKPDVLTLADMHMVVNSDLGYPIKFTFWPKLSTGVVVDSFIATSFGGLHSAGFKGWGLTTGEKESLYDFFMGDPSVEQIAGAPQGTFCSWMGKLTLKTAAICKDVWNKEFGGALNHRFAAQIPLLYPVEFVSHLLVGFMGKQHQITDENFYGDGKWPIYDIEKVQAPLTKEHFGWQIASCETCHTVDNIHDGKYAGDEVRPFECAQCHGNNGAPDGHGETERCYWCHSNDKLMDKHGEASIKTLVTDVECKGNFAGMSAPCANHPEPDYSKFDPTNLETLPTNKPHDVAHNPAPYPEDMLVPMNNEWRTNDIFPDPYSCATCHPNK